MERLSGVGLDQHLPGLGLKVNAARQPDSWTTAPLLVSENMVLSSQKGRSTSSK
jgi:hypothetical protein